MSDKLVKEIITTTTERFGDSGRIKEKITESREKVYSTLFSEEQIKNAELVEKNNGEKTQEESKEELIKAAAANIDSQQVATPAPPYIPSIPQNPMAPQYNVVNRNPSQQAPVVPGQFPWEKN